MLNRNSLIESGAYKRYKEIRRDIFRNQMDPNDTSLFPFLAEETKELGKIYEAHKKRNKRMYEKLCKWVFLKKYVKSFLNYHIIFITMTFTDQQLENTTQETRRRYVTRYLNDVSDHFIANIDFGAKNGREHYHAIAFCKERIEIGSWKEGGINLEEVIFKNDDYIKVIKYINKITNHSFKDTNKSYKVIYDRKKALSYLATDLLYTEEVREFKIANKKSYI